MKKIGIITILVGLSMSSAFALNDIVTVPEFVTVSTVSHIEEKAEKVATSTPLVRVQNRGLRLIDERVKALASNSDAINRNKNLTAEQKTALVGQLNNSSAALMTLRTSIASSTDATSTRALIDSVYKDYRIYGIVIPKVRLEARVYQLKAHTVKLSDTFLKIQSKIDEHKAKGHDVTAWQKNLDDAKTKVAGHMFSLDEILKKTATLTPANYGTSTRATIQEVNTQIQTIQKDFRTISSGVRSKAGKDDMKKMKQERMQSAATGTSGVVR
jgi:hypothetical protein